MLPDWPNLKRLWEERFRMLLNERMVQGSLASLTTRIKYFEGDTSEIIDSIGQTQERSPKCLASSIEVDRQDLIERGPVAFLDVFNGLANDLASQMSSGILDEVNQVTENTGNVVNTGGSDIAFDTILQALAKIEMDFDEEGRPQFPTLVASPETFDKLSKLQQDEHLRRKLDRIIEQKRREWIDRESHRKLVD